MKDITPYTKNTTESYQLKHIQLVIMSMLQRVSGLLIEYPVECVKVRWQGNLQTSSCYEIIRTTHQKYGLSGFYDGFIPNTAKKIPVYFFRWPAILTIPQYYHNKISIRLKHHHYLAIALANIATAFTIATIETPLAAPFDTCRLEWIINKDRFLSMASYFKLNRNIRNHFRGINVLYAKELLGWSSFLLCLNISREFVRKHRNKERLSYEEIIPISLFCGITNSIAITPCDVTRNFLQKEVNKNILSCKTAIKQIKKQQGVKGFFRGYKIRMLQISIATLFSIPAIEKYESETEALNTAIRNNL